MSQQRHARQELASRIELKHSIKIQTVTEQWLNATVTQVARVAQQLSCFECLNTNTRQRLQ